MANDDVRRELSEVAASLRAYLEWQSDTGAWGIPRGPGPSPAAAKASLAASVCGDPPETVALPMAPAAAAVTTASRAPATHAPAQVPESEATQQATSDEPATRAAEAMAPQPPVATTAPAPTLARLPILASEVAVCQRCELAATRTNTVFSRGNPASAICFVGEAPGADEDAQGIPFVGRAGQLLDRMITAMGLSPEKDVYICNIIKCRPPDNRRPTPEEIATCIPYLHEQLASIKPKVIVAMGNTAVSALLDSKLGITKVRGQWKLYRQTLVMPTYHPSYLLRPSAQQQEAKKQAWEDLQAVMKELKLPLPKR